jgi:hypothetical protein
VNLGEAVKVDEKLVGKGFESVVKVKSARPHANPVSCIDHVQP